MLKSDRGSTTPLVLVFMVIIFMLVSVGVGATSLYIERKRLFTVADGAALAGAQSYGSGDVTIVDGKPTVHLRNSRVHEESTKFVRRDPGDLEQLELLDAYTPDSRSALVRLRALWRPPLVSELIPVSMPIEVTAIARTRLGLEPADR